MTRLEELSQQAASLEYQLRVVREQLHDEMRKALAPSARERPSGREEDVLHLIQKRLSNKEIADRLNISVRTVKFHVASLFRKFAVRSRHDL